MNIHSYRQTTGEAWNNWSVALKSRAPVVEIGEFAVLRGPPPAPGASRRRRSSEKDGQDATGIARGAEGYRRILEEVNLGEN